MNQTLLDRRRAGLLVPVYALRREHDFGIGDTLAVKEALDFAKTVGFSVLQILPIHEMYGDYSPYCPISSRALSPALLALTPDEVPGLTVELLDAGAPEGWLAELRAGNVSHEIIHPLKYQILVDAYHGFLQFDADCEEKQEFQRFCAEQAEWLEPYSLFRLLIREYEGNTVWTGWRPEHRSVATAEAWLARDSARQALEYLRDAYRYIQWVAWRQWKGVREHADRIGMRLMGEISFGVSLHSADAWANPSLFEREWSLGTPPLAHFDTTKDSERWGQNWGLPPFRWDNHRGTGFRWLRGRIAWAREFFHACRIDHLRGYFRGYMFPWAGGARHVEFSQLNEEEAVQLTGGLLPRFVPGPDEDPQAVPLNEAQGREIISQIIDAAGPMDIVAEIMGDLPEYMARTLDDLSLANLVFPQLQKNARRSIHAPENLRDLSLVSYANHDNAPLAMLYLHLRGEALRDETGSAAEDLKALLAFAGWTGADYPPQLEAELLFALQRALFATHCRLAVLMCSDLIGVPLRFNLPGSYGKGTWSDRLEMPLNAMLTHAVYGPRIHNVSHLIAESGRG